MNQIQLFNNFELNYWNWLPSVLVCMLLFSIPVSTLLADDDAPKQELTIKEIMNKAHKPATPEESTYLLKKVATGKATQEEATQLHAYYEKLAALTPPKGEQASWTAKTSALVAAAKAAVDKEEGFKAKLRAASDCAACHQAHQ